MLRKFSEGKDFYYFLALIFGALKANNANKKKQSLEIINFKSITAPGKTIWETGELEKKLTGRSADVTETVEKSMVDFIAVLQEIRYRNAEMKM